MDSEDRSIVRPLDSSEVDIKTTRGSGPGGQHRNRTDSCVVATHIPTGMVVRIDARSQHQNKALALKILASRVAEKNSLAAVAARADIRKRQVGMGCKADKRRTYRFQDDAITDHITGKGWNLRKWFRGDWA